MMDAQVNSAFPTVSSVVNVPKRSIFDKENENSQKVITAAVNYIFYTINEKRSKLRNGFVVINTPVIEIHKSQKNSKNNKVAKHFVNMAEIFNVCIQKEQTLMKSDCLSLMDLSETYLIRPIDAEFTLEDWYEYVLEKCRAMRSAKLVRSVFREEYFEASWDVVLSKKPKLRRDYNKHSKIDDLIAKHSSLEGHHRLCVHAGAILIFKIGATPTTSVEVPFDKSNFINLPLNVISSYGHQEKFFILRSGRFSEIGSGELWMYCGDGLNAKAVHDRIIEIVTRETDRRQAQGVVRQNWPSATNIRTRKSRDRREDLQATGSESGNVQKSESNMRLRIGTNQSAISQSRKNSNANSAASLAPIASNVLSKNLAKDRQSEVVSLSKSQDKSQEALSTKLKPCSGSFTCKKSSLAGLLPFRLNKLSTTNSPAPSELHSPLSAIAPTSVALTERARHGGSTGNMSISAMPSRLTSAHASSRPASSGILSGLQLDKMSSSGGHLLGAGNYNCAEDYMTYDAKDNNNFNLHYPKPMTIGSVVDDSPKNSATLSGILVNSSTTTTATISAPIRQFSVGSLTVASDANQQASSNEKDYLEMDENMSSGASNVRAYSLGSKPKPPPVFMGHRNCDAGKSSPISPHGSMNSPPLRLRPSSNPAYAEHSNISSEGSSQRRQLNSISGQHHQFSQHNLSSSQSAKLQQYELKKGSAPSSSTTSSPSREVLSDIVKDDLVLTTTTTTAEIRSNVSMRSSSKILPQKVPTSSEQVHGSGISVASANATLQNMNVSVDNSGNDVFTDLRKRAHSVGSKSWIKPTLRKISGKRSNISARASSNLKNSNALASDNLPAEIRTRADSASSGGGSATCFDLQSNFIALNERRRNSSRFNSAALRSIVPLQTDSQDHVELDFDRDGSCPSIDSPSNRSRNSSFGVQLSASMRSALDLALTSHCSFLDKPGRQDRYLENFANRRKVKENEIGSNGSMFQRKRSVPELIDLSEPRTSGKSALDELQSIRTITDKAETVNVNSNQNEGASSSSNLDSQKNKCNGEGHDDDDYVLMELIPTLRGSSAPNFNVSNSAPKLKSSNPANCSRVISTIIESAYSSSSHSESSSTDSDAAETNSLSKDNLLSHHALFAIGGDESSDGKSPSRENRSAKSKEKLCLTTPEVSPFFPTKKHSSSFDCVVPLVNKTSPSTSLPQQLAISDEVKQLIASPTLDSGCLTEAVKQVTLSPRRSSVTSHKLDEQDPSWSLAPSTILDDNDYESIISSPLSSTYQRQNSTSSSTMDTEHLSCSSSSPSSSRRQRRIRGSSSLSVSGFNATEIIATATKTSSPKLSYTHQKCCSSRADMPDLMPRKSSTSSSSKNLKSGETRPILSLSIASVKSLNVGLEVGAKEAIFVESTRKSSLINVEKNARNSYGHSTNSHIVDNNKTCDYAIIEPVVNK